MALHASQKAGVVSMPTISLLNRPGKMLPPGSLSIGSLLE